MSEACRKCNKTWVPILAFLDYVVMGLILPWIALLIYCIVLSIINMQLYPILSAEEAAECIPMSVNTYVMILRGVAIYLIYNNHKKLMEKCNAN